MHKRGGFGNVAENLVNNSRFANLCKIIAPAVEKAPPRELSTHQCNLAAFAEQDEQPHAESPLILRAEALFGEFIEFWRKAFLGPVGSRFGSAKTLGFDDDDITVVDVSPDGRVGQRDPMIVVQARKAPADRLGSLEALA